MIKQDESLYIRNFYKSLAGPSLQYYVCVTNHFMTNEIVRVSFIFFSQSIHWVTYGISNLSEVRLASPPWKLANQKREFFENGSSKKEIEYLWCSALGWKVRNLTPTKILVHGVTGTAKRTLGYNMLQMPVDRWEAYIQWMLLMLLLLTIFDWGAPPLILACFFVLGYCLVNYCELLNGRKKSFFLPASRPRGAAQTKKVRDRVRVRHQP